MNSGNKDKKVESSVPGPQLTPQAEAAGITRGNVIPDAPKLSPESVPYPDDDMCYPDNHLDDDERYFLFPGSDSE